MINFFRCKNCLFPSTKPDLHFDDKGICGACNYTDYYENQIDWKAKEKEFLTLCSEIKSRNINSNYYDCIIAVSGGKDSTYQTYLATKIGGLNPLLVSFEPSWPTEIGKKNLDNLKNNFNSDLIQLKKNLEVYKKLARIGFEIVGDHEWPNHVGIYTWPLKMAAKLDINLILYGEPQGLIGQGRTQKLREIETIDRNWFEEYVGMIGLRTSDMMEFDKSLKPENMFPYIFPEDDEIKKSKIIPIFTGNYFKWDAQEVISTIEKHGWKRSDERIEGDYSNFEDLDCGFMPMHQYFKFIKYGYARATDHASYEIRHNRLSKKQAKEYIIEYDSEFPKKYFKEFLNYLDISEEKFFETRDKFTNHELFETDNSLKLKKQNNNQLILNEEWYKSFDI
jgi:N-acetyl sugar amidotransferase